MAPRFSFFRGILRGATIIGLALTAITFWADAHWLADLVAQFRVQLTVGAIVVCLLLALFRSWRFVTACLIGCVLNGWMLGPYLVPTFVQERGETQTVARPDGTYRLLSLNVLTKNRDWQNVIDLIRSNDPDFVVLMEIDSTWHQVLIQLEAEYPHARYEVRSDNFGIAFLSKIPWSSIESFSSASLQLPSLDAKFDGLGGPGGRNLRIIATHPIPPMGEAHWKARNEQLFNVADRLDDRSANLIAGDFNLTPWSPIFKEVLKRGDLKDAGSDSGVEPTWYIFPTWLGGLSLDHVLASPNVTVIDHRIHSAVGSDHRPISLDFRIGETNDERVDGTGVDSE
jgi:endonuclease/exonuclease/phosphatase (EEP) superfamily protein YafD